MRQEQAVVLLRADGGQRDRVREVRVQGVRVQVRHLRAPLDRLQWQGLPN